MELKNLYSVESEDHVLWVFAVNQAEALKIALEKEVNHNDFESLTVTIICCENDIINHKN